MTIDLQQITDLGLRGDMVPRELSQALLEDEGPDVLPMAQAAGQVRMATFGRKVKLHQINNIQNGLCPEDCGYCGQSKISDAPLNKYPIKSEDEIVEEAHAAKARGAYRYCMVASGRGPTDNRIDQLAHTVKRINQEVGIRTCLSVGIVSKKHAQVLRDAGLDRLNHNLNTSANHTPNIVTTHTYDDRIQTLRDAKSCGLEICSGIITGMGESNQDILDVAYELRDLDARSIPINFLIPIPGNPLYDFNQLSPIRCLKILCVFRFINPTAEIRIGGGREGHLRSLQALALYPANSLFIEGYLVTRGDKVDKTIQMITDAGFEIDGDIDVDADISSAEKYQIDQDPNILNPKTTVTG
ncbi:MAG: biotin synthase BioB [Candidatus Hinthialibacter antarcticus]|nr:biotin synthase BioB [Candidatus Hinthialibacter antarcticus]